MDRWLERGILSLVLAILVFGPLGLGAARGLEFAVIEGLTAGVVLLWGARLWVASRPQLLWPPICWGVLAFTAYAIARYCTADVEYVARQELMRVLVYAFLFFAILNNLHRQETTQIVSFTMVFLAMGIAGYAIYQFVSGSDYVWHFIKPYPRRGTGTYICPNHLGGFLEVLLPLGLAYTMTGRLKPLTRVFLGYACLVILAGIGSTISRGSWAATGLALLGFFAVLLRWHNYRVPALLCLVLLVGVCVYFIPKSFFFQLRLRQVVTARGEVDDSFRFVLWQPAFEMWREKPWWGVGPAHFDLRFGGFRPERVQLTPDRVHNDYLNTLTDWGVAGFALVATSWGLLGWGVAKTWRQVRPSTAQLGGKTGSNKFAFVLGASVGLVAILIHSIIDFNMHIPANAILVVSLMALLSSHLRFATERFWWRAGLWTRLLLSAVLLVGGVCLVQQGWRRAVEFVWLDRAAKAPIYSRQQVALLTRAISVEPQNPQTAYALGEAYRQQSAEGGEAYEGQEGVDYRSLAERALTWFRRSAELNPWSGRTAVGCGWCLDWLDKTREAADCFDHAEALEPNNYFILNGIGLHYVQVGDFAAARPWFERSLRLQQRDNLIAQNYLELTRIRLLEGATNDLSRKLEIVPR